jgi:hypothetical protein
MINKDAPGLRPRQKIHAEKEKRHQLANSFSAMPAHEHPRTTSWHLTTPNNSMKACTEQQLTLSTSSFQ